ncbi:hypothetical protein AURDEDRAFT_131112 [Auricularia subglabra TFB-10046 SS5]|uniref:Gfd2/YDR514C-like C-terminal domain-containing protein n=1 Tax=Auricularia subglabra (strain TFB-10046 / SS5) TaxID=717982 RepID=J0WQ13_AURST|nr:hypothetical protein AURDEDRAFT_131112 [Auricularia subglabra TFB-10046 SS5]
MDTLPQANTFFLLHDVVHGIVWTAHPVTPYLRTLVRQLAPKVTGDNPGSLSVHPLLFVEEGNVVFHQALRRDRRRRAFLNAEQFDRIVAVAVHLLLNDPTYPVQVVHDETSENSHAPSANGQDATFPTFGDRVHPCCVGGEDERDLLHPPARIACGSDLELASMIKAFDIPVAPADLARSHASAEQILLPSLPTREGRKVKRDYMAEATEALKMALRCYRAANGTWFAVDVEHTRDKEQHTTEIGISTWSGCPENSDNAHFVIQGSPPNNSTSAGHPTPFLFGQSRQVVLRAAIDEVRAMVARAQEHGPLHLHDRHKALPPHHISAGGCTARGTVVWFDTQYIFAGLTGTHCPGDRPISLVNLLNKLDLPHSPEGLHNAGNDAKWTLDSLRSLMARSSMPVA